MSGGDTESIFAVCQRFALGYSELRGEANHLLANASRSPECLAHISRLAERIQSLDYDIATWMVAIPEEYRFTTVCWVSKEELGLSNGVGYDEVQAFPGRVDQYPDFVSAMAWNVGRVSRLILASISIRLTAWTCSPADYRTMPEYEIASRVCEGVISEIIASVPYHLGWRAADGKALGKSGLSGFACGEEGSCKALPALFLIWSLTCVKNHDISTDEQRTWAKGRLKFIAEEVGLKYANIVNEVSSLICHGKR
jgi:hypothetical protein